MKKLLLVMTFTLAGCLHTRRVAGPAAPAVAVETDSSGVPFTTAPEGILKPGAIDALQDRLHAHGLMARTQHSGKLDPPTREALRRFQARNDLPSTGLPSYRTVQALELPLDRIFFSARHPPSAAEPTPADERSAGSRTTP
jgi:hypothetical protein